eukprot:3825180-Prymnesium_polylepis.1
MTWEKHPAPLMCNNPHLRQQAAERRARAAHHHVSAPASSRRSPGSIVHAAISTSLASARACS